MIEREAFCETDDSELGRAICEAFPDRYDAAGGPAAQNGVDYRLPERSPVHPHLVSGC